MGKITNFLKANFHINAKAKKNLKTALTVLFFVAVSALIISKARGMDWPRVWISLRSYQPQTLGAAGVLSFMAYLLYSIFDLLSKKHVQHEVPNGSTLLIAFISYAFNLNFGAWVGGLAFRYRLYTRFGLNPAMVSRVIGFSILSNWSGYVLLTGITLVMEPLTLPPAWGIGPETLRAIGAGLFIAALLYFSLCFFSPRRRFRVMSTELELPEPVLVIFQVLVSVFSWLTIATVLYILLQAQISFPKVLGAFLASGIIAVIAHIPAGIGVLETVIVTLLGGQLPTSEILAAVLAFRAIYYLAPLLVALALYLTLEIRVKRKNLTRVSHRNSHQILEITAPRRN